MNRRTATNDTAANPIAINVTPADMQHRSQHASRQHCEAEGQDLWKDLDETSSSSIEGRRKNAEQSTCAPFLCLSLTELSDLGVH